MKIRNGFVSNSSSSSFLILKPSDKDLTTEAIIEALQGYYEEDLEDSNIIQKVKEKVNTDKGELKFFEIDHSAESEVVEVLDDLGVLWIDMEELF